MYSLLYPTMMESDHTMDQQLLRVRHASSNKKCVLQVFDTPTGGGLMVFWDLRGQNIRDLRGKTILDLRHDTNLGLGMNIFGIWDLGSP